MAEKHKKKTFDCIEMKHKIQEKIAEETKGMSTTELMKYYQKRIAASRFAGLFASEQTTNSNEVV